MNLYGEYETHMNPAKTHSLVGPLVLIGLGSIFLIHNLTEINILKLIWPYWPLVLILIGVSKLVEYYKRKNPIPGNDRG
jgi:hypothetical protein